jgi:hypothetical protein
MSSKIQCSKICSNVPRKAKTNYHAPFFTPPPNYFSLFSLSFHFLSLLATFALQFTFIFFHILLFLYSKHFTDLSIGVLFYLIDHCSLLVDFGPFFIILACGVAHSAINSQNVQAPRCELSWKIQYFTYLCGLFEHTIVCG